MVIDLQEDIKEFINKEDLELLWFDVLNLKKGNKTFMDKEECISRFTNMQVAFNDKLD